VILTRRYSFEAAHVLHGLPDDHPCSRLHGHGYRLEVSVTGPVDPRGMIVEYGELDEVVDDAVMKRYDHRHINEWLDQPTVENMVVDIWSRLVEVTGHLSWSPAFIRLWETERSSVSYP
jgi:6-pyruvoyltetrahydropterin/6-carboxytetrahydropterin synthase